MALFKMIAAVKGQSAVAREIGYSPTVVCQALRGVYPGNMERLLDKVAQVYGTGRVDCPVMGEVSMERCAQERKKGFSTANPLRVKLWKACRDCNPHKRGES